MKPGLFLPLLLVGALAGCAAQRAPTSDYVPAQGGPGYGAGGANTVPGDRPAGGGAMPQGSSGTGVTGSGNAGTYGTGESGSAAASTGAQGASGAGATAGGPDKKSMCALQRRLDAARSEPERQAIIEQALPGMTPDLRQQHLEMLRQQCH